MVTPGGLLVVALGPYEGQLGERIRALKYQEETRFAGPLGRALGKLVPTDWQDACLVPVPLHAERLAERGYNQAALVARAAARSSGLPVRFDLLSRSKQTRAQARLDKRGRQENAAEAFAAHCLKQPMPSVILVDDVVTTGSTFDACAAALALAGLAVFGALALARADKPTHDEPNRAGSSWLAELSRSS